MRKLAHVILACVALTSSSLMASADAVEAKRAFDAMMTMVKIDIAALEAAVAGG